MKTMTEIAADIAANLAANVADIQQRMGKLDAVLEDLRAAGVEWEIDTQRCTIFCTYGQPAFGNAWFQITKHPGTDGIMHDICIKHGSDWYLTESGHPLLSMPRITLRFQMPDSFPKDTTP